MSKVGDYFFEFPASRGMQGSTATYMITAPARALTRILASDNHGSTLERSQREINQARVKKFYQYLVNAYQNKEPFIIPPLVGNCDADIEFEEFGNMAISSFARLSIHFSFSSVSCCSTQRRSSIRS